MIPAALLPFLDGAWRFVRSPAVLGALAVFAFGQWQYSRGEAAVEARWSLEREATAARLAVEAERRAAKAETDAKIQEVVNDAHAKQVAAVLAINDDLAGRMQRAAAEAGALRAAARAGSAPSPAAAVAVAGSVAGGGADDGGAGDLAARIEAALTANAAAVEFARRQCLLDAADRDALIQTLTQRGIVRADQYPGHGGHAH